jgi:hypothetical protein
MALKLLNPGLRPLGTFDLDDGDAASLTGGEYVELQADAASGADGYAADVGSVGPMGPDSSPALLAPVLWNFGLSACTSESIGGLADEGIDDYGTLFGSLIGSNAGRATSQSGAVTIGPASNRASGKVTVWHQAGLYGVNGTAATGQGTSSTGLDSLSTVNAAVGADTSGLLGAGLGGGDALGVFAGRVTDSSLVSTTNQAAGLAVATEYYAVYMYSPHIAT